MKHLLSGVAIAAALALSAPAWAQTNAGQASSMSNPTSATPPKHRHARTVHHAAHGKTAAHMRATKSGGGNNVANQLNQEELSRLQAGSSMPPPGPPSPTMSGPGPTSTSRALGPKTSGSGYAPSEPEAGTAPPAPSAAIRGPGTGAPR